MPPKLRILFTVVGLGTPLDQLGKFLVERNLVLGESISIVDGFLYVTHTRNPGAAFGLFASVPGDARLILFALVSFVAMVVIFSFFLRLAPGDRSQSYGLSFVLAGALGNLIDRVRWGWVIDFIDVGIGTLRWPVFNIADSAITVGVIIWSLQLLFSRPARRAAATLDSFPQEQVARDVGSP